MGSASEARHSDGGTLVGVGTPTQSMNLEVLFVRSNERLLHRDVWPDIGLQIRYMGALPHAGGALGHDWRGGATV